MTNYVLRHEWLREIPDESRTWWETFSVGLVGLDNRGLQLKYTDKGFLHVRFHDVGMSNSQVWKGRNHVSLGYEQSSPFENRRIRYKPIVEDWIHSRTWGEATNRDQSMYREQLIGAPSCPDAAALVDEFRQLVANLEGCVRK